LPGHVSVAGHFAQLVISERIRWLSIKRLQPQLLGGPARRYHFMRGSMHPLVGHFRGRALMGWSEERRVWLQFIEPGKTDAELLY